MTPRSVSRPVVAALVAAATAFCLATAAPAAAAEAPNLEAPYSWTEEFDSPAALDSWNIFNQPDYNYDDALYTPNAIEVVDGQLIITTQRHCVDEDIDLHDPANRDLLTEENASVAPCADDEFQKFTSGRLQSPDIARGEFDIAVTGSIDTGNVNGVRSAIWMQNEAPACSQGDPTVLYGELDLVEHFSYDARSVWSPSNTHLGCAPLGQNGTNDAPRELQVGSEMTGQPHTWTASTAQDRVAYYFDGRPINRESWHNNTVLGHAEVEDFGLSQHRYEQILDQNWKLILNQKVETADWTKPRSADEDFPVRTMTIDRIEVAGQPFTDLAPATGSAGELSSSLSSRLPSLSS